MLSPPDGHPADPSQTRAAYQRWAVLAPTGAEGGSLLQKGVMMRIYKSLKIGRQLWAILSPLSGVPFVINCNNYARYFPRILKTR